MRIMDCTLRDGANVLGFGFPKDLTEMILKGLTDNHIPIIEMGNAKGLGAYEVAESIAPLNDEEYLEIMQPFICKAEIGMFLNAKRFSEKYVRIAATAGLSFLRVGADAGDAHLAEDVIKCVKENGIKAYYSQMKAYLLSPKQLAEEAHHLEEIGVDEITIMDSAGVMWPTETASYISSLKQSTKIPIGFHGHNNLFFSIANCISAANAGADILDGGLLGMARSAGNAPTEMNVAVMRKQRTDTGVDFYGLLHFLEDKLIPAMEHHGFSSFVKPLDIILGYAGCHSSFVSLFRKISNKTNVDLYKLIVNVSKQNRKNPDEKLIYRVALSLQEEI